MIEFRPARLQDDRDFILDMFLTRSWESASDIERRPGLNKYGALWLASPEAESALRSVETSLGEAKTIADIVLVNRVPAGFVWATLEGEHYEEKYFRLRLVAFKLNFQRQGLGRVSIHHLEELACERGAVAIRSTGSARSDGIRRFHDSVGFVSIETVYEKRLAARVGR